MGCRKSEPDGKQSRLGVSVAIGGQAAREQTQERPLDPTGKPPGPEFFASR